MPLVWDLEEHKRLKEASSAINVATQITLATKPPALPPSSTPKSTSDTLESSMRNWVLKTLAGFNMLLLTRFPKHYPDLEDDFLELSLHIDEVTIKVRKANHLYTKK